MEIAPSYVTGALLRGGQRRKTYPGEERAVGRSPVRSAALQRVALYDAALVLAIAQKEQSNGKCAVICRRSFAPWRPTTQTRGIKIQTLAIAGVFLLPTMARQYSLSISSFRSPEKERIISDRDNNRWKSFLLNYENRNVSLASLNCQRWDTGL